MSQDTLVSVTYQFIFSKQANIWNNVFDFEKDLSAFFMSNGLEAQTVNTVRGSTGGRIVMISKVDEAPVLTNTKGVNMRPKTQSSSRMVNGLSKQINDSFNAQNVRRSK